METASLSSLQSMAISTLLDMLTIMATKLKITLINPKSSILEAKRLSVQLQVSIIPWRPLKRDSAIHGETESSTNLDTTARTIKKSLGLSRS